MENVLPSFSPLLPDHEDSGNSLSLNFSSDDICQSQISGSSNKGYERAAQHFGQN